MLDMRNVYYVKQAPNESEVDTVNRAYLIRAHTGCRVILLGKDRILATSDCIMDIEFIVLIDTRN